MITGFILLMFYEFVAFVVAFLPTIAFPSGVGDAIALAWGYVNQFTFLFPVGTLVTVLSIAMTFHGALLLWRLGHLVASYIRGR